MPRITRNRVTYDTADTVDVTLNSTTAVTISVANADRVFFHVNNNNSNNAFWVRLYPAAQDDTKHGIYVSGKNGLKNWWDMQEGEKYTGEISAIAELDSPIAHITEG